MFSGSDSTESQNYAQWALNPSTYQNMANDQVDWAALAQQWIIMKEAGPPPLIPQDTVKPKAVKKENFTEGGEAPMDVENDKDEGGPASWNNVAGGGGTSDWSWNPQSQTWGWNNQWTPPTGVPPPVPMKTPLLPTPGNFQYSTPPDTTNDNATFAGYSTTGNSDYSSGYWTSAGSSKQIKPHNRRFSKVNVPRSIPPVVQQQQHEVTQPPLDAAKRKQLPAWIREGLEKMERDKQKQMEREKEKLEREEYNEKLKQNEKETMEILKSTIKEQQKSKFESEGELSEEELSPKRKKIKVEPVVPLTPEEQMMNVRRTMTEILLKVTNREIEAICREELQRHHKKHKASDHRVSAPSGANVTARLGLGIYGGSGSSSSSEPETDGDESQDRRDSDSELRDTIKRKKAEFSKTEKEIEEKLAVAENRNKHQESASRSSTPDTNDNDTQVDAKSQGHHHYHRKKRSSSSSSRKTSSKRAKSRSSSTSSSSSCYTKQRHRSSTRSSSGGLSTKKFSSKRRSRTPEKSHSKTTKRRSRSGSRHSRRDRNRKSSRSRSRSVSYGRRRSRRSRSKSLYGKRRRSRSSRRRRSRSSSSGRGKKSRRR